MLVSRASQCHCIGRQKVFVRAEADDQRATETRADDTMRFVLAENGNGIRTRQTLDGFLYRTKQVAVVQMIDQMRDDLGIGLRHEFIAKRFELGTNFFVIFDNAVVN